MAKIWQREHDYKCNMESANEIHESLKERKTNYLLCVHCMFGITIALLNQSKNRIKEGIIVGFLLINA